MAPIHHEPYRLPDQSLFIRDLRGNARARANISSPLSIYSASAEINLSNPTEPATHVDPRASRKATEYHAARRFRQSVHPQRGHSRVLNSDPYPRAMASDHGPCYFPFYSSEGGVNQAHDVRDTSRGDSGMDQNILREQAYQPYASKTSADQLERFGDYYRVEQGSNHVHRLNNHTSRAHRQTYSDPTFNVDRTASRGFPVLADRYQLEHWPHTKTTRRKHENNHPDVYQKSEHEHRHASMATPVAITDHALTGSARLQQSFETRRRVREPRSAMY